MVVPIITTITIDITIVPACEAFDLDLVSHFAVPVDYTLGMDPVLAELPFEFAFEITRPDCVFKMTFELAGVPSMV